MKYNPEIHNRKTIRLKGYDYSQAGMYYITVFTANRECVLGEVIDKQVKMSVLGEIARSCWEEIPKHFSNTVLDRYVMMPNHIHGIVILKEFPVGTRHAVSSQVRNDSRTEFGKPISGSRSTIGK